MSAQTISEAIKTAWSAALEGNNVAATTLFTGLIQNRAAEFEDWHLAHVWMWLSVQDVANRVECAYHAQSILSDLRRQHNTNVAIKEAHGVSQNCLDRAIYDWKRFNPGRDAQSILTMSEEEKKAVVSGVEPGAMPRPIPAIVTAPVAPVVTGSSSVRGPASAFSGPAVIGSSTTTGPPSSVGSSASSSASSAALARALRLAAGTPSGTPTPRGRVTPVTPFRPIMGPSRRSVTWRNPLESFPEESPVDHVEPTSSRLRRGSSLARAITRSVQEDHP